MVYIYSNPRETQTLKYPIPPWPVLTSNEPNNLRYAKVYWHGQTITVQGMAEIAREPINLPNKWNQSVATGTFTWRQKATKRCWSRQYVKELQLWSAMCPFRTTQAWLHGLLKVPINTIGWLDTEGHQALKKIRVHTKVNFPNCGE